MSDYILNNAKNKKNVICLSKFNALNNLKRTKYCDECKIWIRNFQIGYLMSTH